MEHPHAIASSRLQLQHKWVAEVQTCTSCARSKAINTVMRYAPQEVDAVHIKLAGPAPATCVAAAAMNDRLPPHLVSWLIVSNNQDSSPGDVAAGSNGNERIKHVEASQARSRLRFTNVMVGTVRSIVHNLRLTSKLTLGLGRARRVSIPS